MVLRQAAQLVVHVFDRQPVRRDFRWKRELGDALDPCEVIGVGRLFECLAIRRVPDQ